MTKRTYVALVRALRIALAALGLLALLDRWAAHSRTGLWVRSWLAVYDLEDMVALGVPWWTFDAVDRVEAHLAARPDARVLEWGSGASTVWLAARAAGIVSVEHDVDWAWSMRPRLPAHVQLLAVPPVSSSRPTTPSAKKGFAGLDFSDYVDAGRQASGPFDLVVVDGRAREACLRPGLALLAPEGLLVFDNVDRRRYRESLAALGDTVVVEWTRGRTPALPYPTRTALVRHRHPGA